MTRDEVVQMAHYVGIFMQSHQYQVEPTKLERFAAMVAAAEREACAKVCLNVKGMAGDYADKYATAIRARGNV